MAKSNEGSHLFAVNTPDNTLQIYNILPNGTLNKSVRLNVGMEPVAVAVRPKLASGVDPKEVWVVNHLSDSVSIVDISTDAPYIKQTLLVGDEPRDIVFARDKAFITTAHRGQQRLLVPKHKGGGDPELHKEGVPRADVWVFRGNPGRNGMPKKIVELFGDTPRGLAVSPDGNTVYAAVFNSGNQTSIVHESVLCRTFQDFDRGEYRDRPCQTLDGQWLPGGRTAPSTNKDGVQQPLTSMIVKYDQQDGKWKDSGGWDFSAGVRLSLPDKDVFAIDARSLTETDYYTSVGTTLFNMVVNPRTGSVYVSNTESNNATRFEGPGIWLKNEIEEYQEVFPPLRRIKDVPATVQGNIARSRITVIKSDGRVNPVHLNPHIDYSKLKQGNDKNKTIATPTQLDISNDGKKLYLTAMGSNKVAVFDTSALESGNAELVQNKSRHIRVDGGPAGLLLNDGIVYAATRYDNAVVVLNANSGREMQRITMHNPEPAKVQAGRFMLYDAHRSSSNGEASCASCHVFGDTDHLSWNLGNPDGGNTYNPLDFERENIAHLGCSVRNGGVNDYDDESCEQLTNVNGTGDKENVRDFDGNLVTDNLRQFASMKGPMATQTMRGMSTHGALHWRGDRSNGFFSNKGNMEDERTSFRNFIVAFEGLLGLDVELNDPNSMSPQAARLAEDMDRFADFMLSVQLPPNPIRPLDNSHSVSAQQGRDFFFGRGPQGRNSDGLDAADWRTARKNDFYFPGKPDGVTCEGCHTYEPENGFYGADGKVAHGGEILVLKIPHFRNLYTRVGMFGLPDREGFLPSHTNDLSVGGFFPERLEQVRGFGFLHDGGTDLLFNFLKGGVFDDGETDCSNTNTGLNENLDEVHGCAFNFGNVGIPDDEVRQSLVDFLMESDSDLAPVVGQQITLNQFSPRSAHNRVSLLLERAGTPFASRVMNDVLNKDGGNRLLTECELIVHGKVEGELRGYLYENGKFTPDSIGEKRLTVDELSRLATTTGNSLTFTCVPPGSGEQMVLDRDLDGYLNRDELFLGTLQKDAINIPEA